ncbi:MAG TPA: hypothetical protein VMW53_07655 [archaeon]|nr:hypothetical protein [archaeon]
MRLTILHLPIAFPIDENSQNIPSNWTGVQTTEQTIHGSNPVVH